MSTSPLTVIGGGLSGLAAGYYGLRCFGVPVTIYEATVRLGGWIKTERNKERGFIFESGPRTIRPKGMAGANTLEMIEQLQIPVEGIPSDHAAARNRMVYAKGQLCPLPNSLLSIFRTMPPFSRPLFTALLNDLFTGSKYIRSGDESIYHFAERRFGSEVAQYAVSPMICGICAGDAKEISVRFLMDDLFEKEQRWGGVTKGLLLSSLSSRAIKDAEKSKSVFSESPPSALFERARREKWSMYRPEDGLDRLPATLAKYLREHNANIQLASELRSMTFTADGVRLDVRGQQIDVPHVISSLPAYKLAASVKDQHPSLAGQLSGIPYVDVAVVNLQYSTSDLLKEKAFGFLVPPIERLPILGVIFDSCCFDMAGNTVLTVMMGGRWFEQNFGKSPSQKQLLDTAMQQLDSILGIKQEPRTSRVHVLHKCIPQYTVGHKQRVADIRRYITQYNLPLSVCGAAYDGVGINDVILSARRQVEQLLSSTSAMAA